MARQKGAVSIDINKNSVVDCFGFYVMLSRINEIILAITVTVYQKHSVPSLRQDGGRVRHVLLFIVEDGEGLVGSIPDGRVVIINARLLRKRLIGEDRLEQDRKVI